MKCPICGKIRIRTNIYTLPFYIEGNSIESNVHKCNNCGVHFREIDFTAKKIKTHFDVTSYMLPENEKHYKESREYFFRYILMIAESYQQDLSNKLLLDIGCSYGDLMKIFLDIGKYNVFGVEINESMRKRLKAKGFKVFDNIVNIPQIERYDLITSIDSLYYFESPVEAIRKFHIILKNNGLLLIRITNRAWITEIFIKLKLKVPYGLMGDAKYSFTYRAMKELLLSNGFRIERLITSEKGKKHSSLGRRLFYWVTQFNGKFRIPISPGLILVCRKEQVT